MKILLSAYACHPHRDSEDRLGWQWAIRLAERGHTVWVVTRGIFRPDVEAYFASAEKPANLHFIYYECTLLLPVLRLLQARFRYFYHYVWQWGAYRAAARVHAEQQFDLAHHVTWVQFRAPSFMGRLGIPFIFGPVGGGEATPWPLRPVIGLRQWLVDLLRDAWSLLARVDPLVNSTYRDAIRIPVTSADTLRCLPSWARCKAPIQLAIAYEAPVGVASRHRELGGAEKFLFVGRFLGLKGMALGLAAFAVALRSCPTATLTMVGKGPAGAAWRKLASRLGLADCIEWIDWLPHDQTEALYARHDVLLFPSLHDSGGLVVLEAMARGLPVVCLDLGGPGTMVDESSGIKVEAAGRSRHEVEVALAHALERLCQDPELFARLSSGAVRRAAKFNWDGLISAVYAELPRSNEVVVGAD